MAMKVRKPPYSEVTDLDRRLYEPLVHAQFQAELF
jgi:hypothetical protein